MFGQSRHSCRQSLAFVGVALYAFFLLVSPFEHHDLLCHLKTPQHCTSCASSQLGSDPQALEIPAHRVLGDAGRAFAVDFLAEGVLLAVQSTGRSPPFSA